MTLPEIVLDIKRKRKFYTQEINLEREFYF